jgi:Protein of unknown function (DUF3631)
MTQFGQHSKPANGKRLQGLEAREKAATAIERVREGFDVSLGSELIRNIRSAFEEAGNPACLSSVDLLARLTANQEWPWASAQKGNPLDQRGLANRLRDYGVRPEVVHPTRDVSPRGYKLAAFQDVFERYLEGDSENLTARTHATNNDGGFYAHGEVHATRSACRSEIVQNVNKINDACECADRKPEKDLLREKPALGPPGDSLEDFDSETDGWPS